VSLLARPLSCGVCEEQIAGVAQWTMTRGWIHPVCELGLPEVREPWYCPICDAHIYLCGPEIHAFAPVHLEALADLGEVIPEPIAGQLSLIGEAL
jgi:hypothetical protein